MALAGRPAFFYFLCRSRALILAFFFFLFLCLTVMASFLDS
jgi:hypothetical protein